MPGLSAVTRARQVCQAFPMPYFLEYATGAGTGHIRLEALDLSDVLAKAEDALRGMNCLSAALLYSPDPVPAFGKGSTLATYTRAHGWIPRHGTAEARHYDIVSLPLNEPERSDRDPTALRRR